jgi:hypothetical protein
VAREAEAQKVREAEATEEALRVQVDESPSLFAEPAVWRKYQFPELGGEPAFSCFRPAVFLPRVLPAALVSSVFGQFLDDAEQPLESLGPCELESSCLSRMLSLMPGCHDREDELQDEMNEILSTLLGGPVRVFMPNSRASRSTTDGGLFAQVQCEKVLLVLVEYKKDLFTNKCDPSLQMLRELQLFWEERKRAASALLLTDACPVLLIEVAGPVLRISAAATLQSNRVMFEPLNPLLHVLDVRDQPLYMARLMATLRALRRAVDGLRAHYSARDAALGAAAFRAPAWRSADLLLPFPLRDGARFSDVRPLVTTRLLYTAKDASGAQVCVKFSRLGYGAEVHAAWAAAGAAPALHQCTRLAGGLHMVVMELLSRADGWLMLSELRGAELAAAGAAALAALARCHALPLPCGRASVHGDCRPVNVLVRPCEDGGWAVRFVDFDCAGAVGVRLYPPRMAASVPWPAGASPGMLLLPEHDSQLLSAELLLVH